MDPVIRQNISALNRLCAKYGVRRLELFGSAARGGFDSSKSDLDFLVEFLALEPGQHADAYFGLKEELESLFGREVDLVMDSAVVNPYFREELDRTRTELYAAWVAEASERGKVIAFRNILIHAYAVIDDTVVWDIVQTKLPVLAREIDALLDGPV